MEITLEDLILRLSRRSTNCGYAYLKKAVELVLERGTYPQRKLMSDLYPQVAAAVGKSVPQVSRGIGRAAEDIWENGGGKQLRELLHKPRLERPAPGELIYYMAYIVSGGNIDLE